MAISNLKRNYVCDQRNESELYTNWILFQNSKATFKVLHIPQAAKAVHVLQSKVIFQFRVDYIGINSNGHKHNFSEQPEKMYVRIQTRPSLLRT